MTISLFLDQSNKKKIFIIECENEIIAQAYEHELCKLLQSKFKLRQKRYNFDRSDIAAVLDELHAYAFLETSLIILNCENFPIEKVGDIQHFFLLRCKKFYKKIAGCDNILHIAISKRYDIFNDLIKYYARQNDIKLDFAARSLTARYLFNNNFSILKAIEKLKLYFNKKNIISVKDLLNYFNCNQNSINKLNKSLALSDIKSFFEGLEVIQQNEGMLIIRSSIRYFSAIFEFLRKSEGGMQKQDALHEAKKQNFYDTQVLEDFLQNKMHSKTIQKVLVQLLYLEGKYKSTKLCKRQIILCFMYEIFFSLKNTKLALEKSA